MSDLTEARPGSVDPRLSGLVHDLNNVFQALVDVAEMLSAEARNEFLAAAILRSVERGKNLTAGLHALEGTGASFEEIADGAVQFVQDSLIKGGRAIRFERKIEPGIELQRNWAWERVLINLLSNAVREMTEGGTIEITARLVKRSKGGTRLQIVVRDDGPGIAPEILARIFKPYVSTRGSGLGLHSVETIVKQDGGKVRAANRTDGGGAEFTIVIPHAVSRKGEAASEGASPKRNSALRAHA